MHHPWHVHHPDPNTPQSGRKEVSPVSKYLTTPTASSKPSAPSQSRAITGARVLTSDQCLALIQEKELKKKKQEEEKENRKKIREEKRKQKEEEKQKKAEEKAKREQEKIRKAAEKEAEKARRAEASKRKAQERREAEASKRAKSSEQSGGESSSRSTRLRARQPAVPQLDPLVRSDVCCVCNQSYEEDMELGGGVKWVQCACLRWLHEDCVIGSSVASNGHVQLCPFC